jgi:hypothetical protein
MNHDQSEKQKPSILNFYSIFNPQEKMPNQIQTSAHLAQQALAGQPNDLRRVPPLPPQHSKPPAVAAVISTSTTTTTNNRVGMDVVGKSEKEEEDGDPQQQEQEEEGKELQGKEVKEEGQAGKWRGLLGGKK